MEVRDRRLETIQAQRHGRQRAKNSSAEDGGHCEAKPRWRPRTLRKRVANFGR